MERRGDKLRKAFNNFVAESLEEAQREREAKKIATEEIKKMTA